MMILIYNNDFITIIIYHPSNLKFWEEQFSIPFEIIDNNEINSLNCF